jgi:hypothetical protein
MVLRLTARSEFYASGSRTILLSTPLERAVGGTVNRVRQIGGDAKTNRADAYAASRGPSPFGQQRLVTNRKRESPCHRASASHNDPKPVPSTVTASPRRAGLAVVTIEPSAW